MRVRIHFDSQGPTEVILDPEGNLADTEKLVLALKGSLVTHIKQKEQNGGSWVLTMEPKQFTTTGLPPLDSAGESKRVISSPLSNTSEIDNKLL